MCQTDEDCVRLCLDGSPEAFRHLVERYQTPLMKYLVGCLEDQNEAIEAAQEVMVRAYFMLGKLRKAGSFFSWLLGIADRVAKEMRRANQRQRDLIGVNRVAETADVNPQQSNGDIWDLSRAVAELPDVCREVVLLRFYGDQSCAEISSNLSVPLGTVTSRLSRAYAQLRKDLAKYARHDKTEVKS